MPDVINSYRQVREGDTFELAFTTAQHMKGAWHHCGAYDTEAEAREAYDALIKSDLAEGAKVGCRWRLTHDREDEHINVLADKRLTTDGLVDVPADEY